MTTLSCPLCCEEKFADTEALTAHLTAVYKRLRCPLCDIRFDNLMVMIKHLERGCSGKSKEPEGDDEKSRNEAAENSAENAGETEENEETEMIGALSADESADESNEPTKSQEKAEPESETISEDQYVDKNGQLYKRRVVKIPNLWSDLETVKTEGEETEDVSTPIRSTPGASGKSECPICAKPVKGEYSLRLHLETAHGQQTHPCCYCARVFHTDQQLKLHVNERHSMPYSCVYCNKPFNNLLMAKKHVQCHKSSKKPAFQCELCDETAHTNTEIKRHYREQHVTELQPRDAPTPIAPYKKGSLWYEWHDFTYHQTHTTRTGVQVLRCWVDGCWVEVRVPVIGTVAIQGEHTHPPYTWLKERNEMYNSLRRRCMTETTPIRIIYDEEAARFPLGARNLPFPEPSMRMWQKEIRTLSEIMLEEDGVEWAEDGECEGEQSVMLANQVNEVSGRGRKRKVMLNDTEE